MIEDPPAWAYVRADEIGLADMGGWRDTLARYIAAHEQPPADPLYDALKAVVELGRYDTREQTQLLRAELAQRGFCIGPASKEPAA